MCSPNHYYIIRHLYNQNLIQEIGKRKQIQGKWILHQVIGMFQESVNLSVLITDCNSCLSPEKLLEFIQQALSDIAESRLRMR